MSSKLDRVLTSDSWMTQFSNVTVTHLPKFKSDHCPLLIKLNVNKVKGRRNKFFRFFAPWITHKDFPEVVKRSWVPSKAWEENVGCFVGNIKGWNCEVFGSINKKKASLLHRLDEINMRFDKGVIMQGWKI